MYQNYLAFEGWVQNIALDENDLRHPAVAMIQARQAGNPVSDDEKIWINQCINDAIRKARYMVINDTYQFIPARIINCKLFTTISR